jgi:hypothetical protein
VNITNKRVSHQPCGKTINNNGGGDHNDDKDNDEDEEEGQG